MWMLSLLLMLLRWLAVGCMAMMITAGCASPQTVTPIQTGGAGNDQQTGGGRTTVSPTVSPIINYTAGPASPPGGAPAPARGAAASAPSP